MMRFFLRFTGYWILAGGFVALVYDGTRTLGDGQLVLTPLVSLWMGVDGTGFQSFQAGFSASYPLVWGLIMIILSAPAALVLCLAGGVLVGLGRPKSAPLVGWSIRT